MTIRTISALYKKREKNGEQSNPDEQRGCNTVELEVVFGTVQVTGRHKGFLVTLRA